MQAGGAKALGNGEFAGRVGRRRSSVARRTEERSQLTDQNRLESRHGQWWGRLSHLLFRGKSFHNPTADAAGNPLTESSPSTRRISSVFFLRQHVSSAR